MILTRETILSEIEAGRIGVEPFDPGAVGPASIDLRLGTEIRVFSQVPQMLPIVESADYREMTHKLDLDSRGYAIKPNELVLGITMEKITLPSGIAGWLSSRSRFSRFGLMVHISAPFMQPGISNHQVLEILNAGPNFLKLVPGERICQFVFERCEGRAVYQGHFAAQREGSW
jgi:dCTP deaminase